MIRVKCVGLRPISTEKGPHAAPMAGRCQALLYLECESPMPLHELVYLSLAERPMSENELCELLTKARAYNEAHGITGLLIYRDREFMQLIEGEQADVMALFTHIERDRRHRQVHCVWEGPISARSCQGWTMGLATPQDAELRALPGGQQIVDEGLFAAGRSSAGKHICLHLRDDVLRRAQPSPVPAR